MRWVAVALALSCLSCPTERGEPIPVPALEFGLAEHWPERTTYPGVGAGRLVVTNSLDDTVSLIDLASVGAGSLVEVARIPVGLVPVEIEAPHHAAISPAGDYYYVALSNYAPGTGSGPHGAHGTGTVDGSVLKLRASDNRTIGAVRVDRNPGDLTISPDGKTLYVTHFDQLRIQEVEKRGGSLAEMDARMAIIDTETMTRRAMVPVCPAPHGVKLSADGKRAYVACISDELAVVQLDADGYPVARVKVALNAGSPTQPTHQPYSLTIGASGEVWVGCLSGDAHVYVPSAGRFDSARTLLLGGSVLFGTFSRDGRTLYLPRQGDDRIAVIDAATGQVQREISFAAGACRNVHALELAPGGQLLAVCEGNHRDPGTVVVLDPSSGQTLQVLEVGVYPDYVGVLKP